MLVSNFSLLIATRLIWGRVHVDFGGKVLLAMGVQVAMRHIGRQEESCYLPTQTCSTSLCYHAFSTPYLSDCVLLCSTCDW